VSTVTQMGAVRVVLQHYPEEQSLLESPELGTKICGLTESLWHFRRSYEPTNPWSEIRWSCQMELASNDQAGHCLE
jgi:hypothetical protein